MISTETLAIIMRAARTMSKLIDSAMSLSVSGDWSRIGALLFVIVFAIDDKF